MTEIRKLGCAAIGALLFGVVVSAQASKWAGPYQDGVKAVNAKKYSDAVVLLERAVAAEPKAEAGKYVEGVFRLDYFPYYYLGVAYFELHQYDKAQQNFEKARNPAPNDKNLQMKFNDYQHQLQALLTPNPSPPVATVNAAFEPALRQAESAFAAKRYADTLAALDRAKSADQAEYAKENIQAKRDDAARTWALQLDDEGRTALPASVNTARAKFEQADQTFGGLKETSDGLVEIKRREDQYQQSRNGAEQDIRASNWKAALAKFDAAKNANSEQFAADNLSARVAFVNDRLSPAPPPNPPQPGDPLAQSRQLYERGKLLASQGKYAEAEDSYAGAIRLYSDNTDAAGALQSLHDYSALVKDGLALRDKKGSAEMARKRFEDARARDPERFQRDGLAAILNALIAAAGQDPAKESLRQALTALLGGNAQDSIVILEQVLNQQPPGNAPAAAPLHAYLGVAYATRALSSAKPDEQGRLSNVALEQFRLALSSERDYQLSPRIVSPKILALFEQARH